MAPITRPMSKFIAALACLALPAAAQYPDKP